MLDMRNIRRKWDYKELFLMICDFYLLICMFRNALILQSCLIYRSLSALDMLHFNRLLMFAAYGTLINISRTKPKTKCFVIILFLKLGVGDVV